MNITTTRTSSDQSVKAWKAYRHSAYRLMILKLCRAACCVIIQLYIFLSTGVLHGTPQIDERH